MTIDPDLTISVTPVSLLHNTFVDAIFLHVYRLFVNPPNPTVNALYKIPRTPNVHTLSRSSTVEHPYSIGAWLNKKDTLSPLCVRLHASASLFRSID